EKARAAVIDGLMSRLLDPRAQIQSGGPARSYAAAAQVRFGSSPTAEEDDPAALVGALEASAEGCRRLLAEWTRIEDQLDECQNQNADTAGEVSLDSAALGNLADPRRLLRVMGLREKQAEAFAALDPSV